MADMAEIRAAHIGDLSRVFTIVREATRRMDADGIAQWDEVYPDRQALQADIENLHLYILEEDDTMAGFAALNEEQPAEYASVPWHCSGRVLVIHRLTVDPARQGKGFGSQLLSFAERHAAERGYRVIRLDAFSENPAAVALYERRGYRRAGTVRFRKGTFICFEKPVIPRTG